MNKLTSIVEKKLKFGSTPDLFAEDTVGLPQRTVIPLLDFADATDSVGSPTDLAIRFRPQRQVDGLEIQAFDKELHQYAITVKFWIHYLKEYEYPIIKSIVDNITLDN